MLGEGKDTHDGGRVWDLSLEVSHSSNNFLDRFTGARLKRGQWWAGPHLGRNLLEVHFFGALL